MNKESYLALVRKYLAGLPEEDIQRSLDFYRECIEDRIEDGMDEEEAVASLPSPEDAAREVLLEQPLQKLAKARAQSARRPGALEIVLLVLGSPVWLPLCIAALVVLLSFFIVLWALVLSLGATALALALSALAAVVSAVVALFRVGLPLALLTLGSSLVVAGVAIGLGIAVYWAGRLVIALGKAALRGIKTLLIKKEERT